MADTPINLNQNYGPSEPVNVSGPNDFFPTLHYEGDEELDLPQSGTMTVRFRVKREVEETDRNGKCHYSCDIEISSIEKVKGDDLIAPAKSGSEAADALDKLAAEASEGDEKY